MSTSKQIDKICIIVTALALVITILFMNGASLGIAVAENAMGYETRLFSTDRVHTIDIVMNDWDSFVENCENEEYEACTVVIDGEKCGNVGIRAKGNTSLSSVRSMDSERYSFKIEFDQYEKGKSYHGLDKLCLNNLIQDNTMMKDYLVYQMMYDFGADSPLCSYAYITVNGEDWGLYLAVEGVEEAFLERNYGTDAGELYKPDSMNFGGGRGNGKDFRMEDFDFEGSEDDFGDFQMPGNKDFKKPQNMNFEKPQDMDFKSEGLDFGGFEGFGGFGMGSDDVKLKYIDDDPDSYSNIFGSAKTDISSSDQSRLISSLKNLSSYTDLENTLDIEEVLRYFVVHNFVCNGDSYTGSMIHNYYLHEKDGKLAMIPWDYNLGFGTFQGGDASGSVNADIDSPVSGGNMDDRPMVGWIFSDSEYTDKYHELFSEFIDKWFRNGELLSLINETAEMLRPYIDKDPTKFCTAEEFEKGIDVLSKFVTLRAEAVKRQLSGDAAPVETENLNLSDMGSMGGGMGRGGSPDFDFEDGPSEFDFKGGSPDFSPRGDSPDFNPGGGPSGFDPDRKKVQ